MSVKVLVGTSGYSYGDWVGPVYPSGTAKKDFLSVFSNRFSIVELNFSYYRQPDAHITGRMVEETDPGFFFAIKAHKSITHTISEDWRTEVAVYRKGIQPLIVSKRLTAVLLQFPFSFHYEKENRIYLDRVCSELQDLPLVLEFRHADWQATRVYHEMRSRNIGLAVADYPALHNLPKPTPVITSDIGYVRFHGRNAKNWWGGTNASRYDYLYGSSELDEWVERITGMSRNAKVLVIVFNNHWRGKAAQNADELKAKLQKQKQLDIR